MHGADGFYWARRLVVAAVLAFGAAAGIEAVRAGDAHWAYQPLAASVLPRVETDAAAAGPVDALHAAALARRGLRPAGIAKPRELVRRLYADLLGLPPDPDTVLLFEADPAREKWENLVDRLLASPRFGERWGRHWLDLVRYADTNGYERDGEKPFAWRYRDYVIQAWNSGMPYDQFIREQLAGDLLEGAGDRSVTATGFYRLHVWDDEPDDPVRADYDELDDVLSTVGAAFLGSTIGCARCHEHKFDPVSQEDYYALAALLGDVQPYGLPHRGGGSRPLAPVLRDLAPEERVRVWEHARQERLERLRSALTVAAESDRSAIEKEIRQVEQENPPWPKALAVTSRTAPAPEARVLRRGDPHMPGDAVEPGFPPAFGGGDPLRAEGASGAEMPSRLRLANWVAAGTNPLTARVMANRLWQHLFGEGLVPTPDDFGAAGIAPENGELLDYLASRLIELDWSVKAVLREILLSSAYAMRSDAISGEADAADPANRLFWRQNVRRLEGEAMRDSLLQFSGKLNLAMGGAGFFPELPEEFHGTQDSARKGWGTSDAEQRSRRSVYAYVKRALPAPLLDAFDAGVRSFPLGQRPVSTVAPQALMLLNDAFVVECGEALAARLVTEAGEERDACIERGFALVLQRPPREEERAAAIALLDSLERRGRAEGYADAKRKALEGFCQCLFNLNEVLYIE